MNIESDKRGNAVWVRISGRMDAVSAPRFDEAFGQWIEEGAKNLVVDLGEMDYISSAGLRSILSAGKGVKARGGSLALCNLKGMVKEIFEISGFVSIFPVYSTAEEALAQI